MDKTINGDSMKRSIILFLLIIFSQEGVSMGIFDAGKTCVFSAVKARLTNNGEPIRGAKVIRRWEWNKLQEEFTTTDENGQFELPAVFESSMSRMLPMELVIAQGLYVAIDGEEKKFWSNSKREPEENAEFQGRSIDLSCEITNESKIYRDFGSRMRTLCTWEE